MSDFQSYSNNGLFDMLNGVYRNTVHAQTDGWASTYTIPLSFNKRKLNNQDIPIDRREVQL